MIGSVNFLEADPSRVGEGIAFVRDHVLPLVDAEAGRTMHCEKASSAVLGAREPIVRELEGVLVGAGAPQVIDLNATETRTEVWTCGSRGPAGRRGS